MQANTQPFTHTPTYTNTPQIITHTDTLINTTVYTHKVRRLFKVVKAHWLFAISVLTVRCCCMLRHWIDKTVIAECNRIKIFIKTHMAFMLKVFYKKWFDRVPVDFEGGWGAKTYVHLMYYSIIIMHALNKSSIIFIMCYHKHFYKLNLLLKVFV